MSALKAFALRKKQEVLQAMGRAEATVDDLYVEKLERFQRLEILCQQVQRETSIYFDTLQGASQAGMALAEDFRHLYEGERNAMAMATIKFREIAKQHDELVTTNAKKFSMKIMDPARAYLKSFPPLKARVEERKKLLLEYDGLRNQEPAILQRLEQEMDPERRRRRQQALDDVSFFMVRFDPPQLHVRTEAARAAYEEANRQLHLDLPRHEEQRTRVFDPAFAELITTILNTHLSAASSLRELLRYMETDGSFPETAVSASDLLLDDYTFERQKRDSAGSADPLEPAEGRGMSRTRGIRGGGGKADPLARWAPDRRSASVGGGEPPVVEPADSSSALPFLISGGGGANNEKAAAVAQWLQQTTPTVGDGTSTPAQDLLLGDGGVKEQDLLGADLLSDDVLKDDDVQDWWIVSASRREEYASYFERADEEKTGFVSGVQARQLFVRSELPKDALAKTWDLADQDGDNMLNKKEFSIALHLINIQLNGHALPDVLPRALIESL